MSWAGTEVGRIGANSLIGSVWTLACRLTGLGRIVVVAAVLGPTLFGDLYTQTTGLPQLLFELLTGSLFVSLLVPALVRNLDRGDPANAARVAGGFLTVTLLGAMAVVAVVIVAGPLVLDLLSINVPRDVQRADPAAAWLLLGLVMLQAPLYIVVGGGAAAQNAQGRFALASGAPIVENVGIMAVLGVYAAVFGVGTAAGRSLAGVALLGAGTTLAVALHAAVQWDGARRLGLKLRPSRAWSDPEVRRLVRLTFPSMALAALNVARYVVILVVAAAEPGGVVTFGLAWAFYQLPVALGAKPVSQAALPELSRAHHRGDPDDFRRTFDRGLGLVLFVTVPAAAGYALLSGAIASVVGLGEMASPGARALVAYCLLGLSAGVVGAAGVNFGTQAAYARQDTRRPLIAVATRTALTAVGLGVALALTDGAPLLLTICAVISLSDLVAGLGLCLVVRGALPGRADDLAGALARTVTAATVMVAVVLPGGLLLGMPEDRTSALLELVVVGGLGAASYLLVQRRLRSPELAGLVTAVSHRSRA